MVQYDNEFFRGPPEGSPTLVTDQRPTGVEVYQVMPEISTAAADAPTTAQEEVPKDPPKKKSNARRITKAIKLLASCMAAVVITEAAVNIAATIEPPANIPTGDVYANQWPGVSPITDAVYSYEMDADMGWQIQMPLEGKVWRLTAGEDWRMCWYEGTNSGLDMAYFGLKNLNTGVLLMADLTAEPHYTDHEEDSYTTLTTSTGETLYVRAFFNSFGQYGEEYGLDDSMLAESAELRQALVDEVFAEIEVTPGTADGWQGFQIGDHLYSQQGPEWYGLGGFGDLEIHIPWVNYAADYGLHDKTPYARETVNGITWSIYFAENDTYLWAVPNIDPEICLGGLTARFMCADAVRRGEYINDEEWLEMGGFASASQRQTAVDILIECLQHHYALQTVETERTDDVENIWPIITPRSDGGHHVERLSRNGDTIQVSMGDAGYRITSSRSDIRMWWDRTVGYADEAGVEFWIGSVTEDWGISARLTRVAEEYWTEEDAYCSVTTTDGEKLYLVAYTYGLGDAADQMETKEDEIAYIYDVFDTLIISSAVEGEWDCVQIGRALYTQQSMTWSGTLSLDPVPVSCIQLWTIVYTADVGLDGLTPIAQQTINGIRWDIYHGEYDGWEHIWAVPDVEPEICLGTWLQDVVDKYYFENETENRDWDIASEENLQYAARVVFEALENYYPL